MILGETQGALAGFMTIEPGGYINLAFIRPVYQGTGLFRQLYEKIEDWAHLRKEPLLWTYASLMAQPAFQAMGFLVIHHEMILRSEQELKRAKMEKSLA
ncbi:GNAT family N-acetyltransferase [Roseobacter sp.]|uniref:GNAT family N-acetyltransferase n=1 Tax=Roseobacter sp. TaxID=1907202 RepID=UPI00385A1059